MPDERIIAAIASPAGRAGRIVLRVGGRGCRELVESLVDQCLPFNGVAERYLRIDEMDIPAVLVLFEEGRGYTGEESVEVHLPGNPMIAGWVLEALLSRGARMAEPGEFTARAFFNGRLDLTEAEGVASVISATNARELEAARKLQSGELTRRLRPMTDQIASLLALLEAGIDFSEEEIRFITAEQLRDGAKRAADDLRGLLAGCPRFERLTHSPTIVLCGRPNAGKSTLMNALCGRQRAVVSATAGTTRDLLSAELTLRRGMAQLIDTAGLEESQTRAAGAMEGVAAEMRQRALHAIDSADVLVAVHAADDSAELVQLRRTPDLAVCSKADLLDRPDDAAFAVSVVSGQGVELLRERLDELAFGKAGGEGVAINARHVRLIHQAIQELDRVATWELADELAAEHLRGALDATGEITGLVSAEDVLGRIFSSFCIGK